MLRLHTVLHPTDFSECSQYALTLATSLARDYNARLVLLHVVQPPIVAYGEGIVPPDPEPFYEAARTHLTQLEVPDARLRVERCLEEGEPAAEIRRVAQEIHADLVVLGTHGRTGLGRLLLGSVAEQVVRKAPCPVLVVKTPLTGESSNQPPVPEMAHV